MNLTLHLLTPEAEHRLKERADLSGKNLETVVLEALEKRLLNEDDLLPQSASIAEFEAWFAAHPGSMTTTLDDSRERIYEGRGE